MSEEKIDIEGLEKLNAAFDEYEAEQKERFKNFSVGLLKNSEVRRRLLCLASEKARSINMLAR